MDKINLNDRYIKGDIAFESYGDKAMFSYINTGLPALPLNVRYTFNDKLWRVSAVKISDYNSFVTNVHLELINGG